MKMGVWEDENYKTRKSFINCSYNHMIVIYK